MLPYVGAQTSGQARSYALKEYLKSKLLASSGDRDDADAHDETETMSKQAARPLYKELGEELRAAIMDSPEAMKEWAKTRAPSIAVMPQDWKLELRRIYSEAIATGGAGYGAQEDDSPHVDVDEFLKSIEDALAAAQDEDIVIEAWDLLDVEAVLTNNEDALQSAFDMRKARLAVIDAAKNLNT